MICSCVSNDIQPSRLRRDCGGNRLVENEGWHQEGCRYPYSIICLFPLFVVPIQGLIPCSSYFRIYRVRTNFKLYCIAVAICTVFCLEINIRNRRIIGSKFLFHVNHNLWKPEPMQDHFNFPSQINRGSRVSGRIDPRLIFVNCVGLTPMSFNSSK